MAVGLRWVLKLCLEVVQVSNTVSYIKEVQTQAMRGFLRMLLVGIFMNQELLGFILTMPLTVLFILYTEQFLTPTITTLGAFTITGMQR